MGPNTTMRTSRGEFLENRLKEIATLIEKSGSIDEVMERLRNMLNSNALIRIHQMIDNTIMPKLRTEERQKKGSHRSELELKRHVYVTVLRQFGVALEACLRRDRLDLYEAVLAVIEEVGIFNCKAFHDPATYFLPANPIAHYRAIAEAWRTGKTLRELLDGARAAELLVEAAHFLAQVRAGSVIHDPGHTKIHALQMGVAPVPRTQEHVLGVPQQEICIPAMTFRGPEEIAALRLFLLEARKHGGVKAFFMKIATNLQKKSEKDKS